MPNRIARYYRNKGAGAGADTKDFNIPVGKTVILKAFDYSCPAGNGSGVMLRVDGNVISAAQCCKYVDIPDEDIEGPKTITIELNNTQGTQGAMLGCTIYYEEL